MFYQLIHQGTRVVPCEFLIAARGHEDDLHHQHQLLFANCLAQSEALMKGRTLAEATAQLLAMGKDKAEAKRLAPHRVFTGNRASTLMAIDALSPEALGALLAFYEHRTFTQAVLAGVNPFDQFGVELGKEMAKAIESGGVDFDASTQALIARAGL